MTTVRGRGGLRIKVPADAGQRRSHLAAAVTLVGALVGIGVVGILIARLAQAGLL